jgi:hypothetical protein
MFTLRVIICNSQLCMYLAVMLSTAVYMKVKGKFVLLLSSTPPRCIEGVEEIALHWP